MSYFIPDQSAFDKEDDDDNIQFPKEYLNDSVANSQTVFENGFHYYILNEDTKIYRGLPKHASSFFSINNGPTFFTSTIAGSMQYGFPHEYSVHSPIHLLALDNDENKNTLREHFGDRLDILRILKNQYGNVRNSSTKEDTLFSEFLCENGFQGYMTLQHKTPTDFGGSFHTEIVLCSPDNISHDREINIPDKFVHFITNNISKRNHMDVRSSPPTKRKLPSFDSPVKMQSRNLFSTPGGGGRKRKSKTMKKFKNTRNKTIGKKKKNK